jgi:hypothetical protein
MHAMAATTTSGTAQLAAPPDFAPASALDFEQLLDAIQKEVQGDLRAKQQFVRFRAYGYQTALMSAYAEVRKLAQTAGWEKVRAALLRDNLMAELAVMLNRWVVLATAKDIEVHDFDVTTSEKYELYFQNHVKDQEDRLYGAYRLLDHTVELTRANFLANLKTTIERVVKDWTALEAVFKVTLKELVEIRSTGNDFHKGGTQVMILTFRTGWLSKRTIVYKPGDVEVDCRIAGRTSEALQEHTGIWGPSLFEMLNDAMKGDQKLPPLATYTIFPAVRGSVQHGMADALKNAYGYLEFIPYQGETNREEEIALFYRSIGQVIAVASALSMHDVHQENMIVHACRPTLIDMENTLAGRNTSVLKTCAAKLVYELGTAPSYTDYRPAPKGSRGCVQTIIESRTKNRLTSGGQLVDPRPREVQLLAGYTAMLDLLAKHAKEKIAPWLAGLDAVTTRVVPYPTGEFYGQFRRFYLEDDFDKGIEHPVDEWARDADAQYPGDFHTWLQGSATDPWLQPSFLVRGRDHMVEDFARLDIPSFYCRPGLPALYNSRAGEVRFANAPLPPRTAYFPEAPVLPVAEQLTLEWLLARKSTAPADIQSLRPRVSSASAEASEWIRLPAGEPSL